MLLVGDWAPNHYSVQLQTPSDQYLANLEGPILERNHAYSVVPKAGPPLFSTSLPQEHPFIFTLANNHMMDYGLSGLATTIHHLQNQAIPFLGAAQQLTEARKPLIIEEENIKIGIIACCEAQFGVANSSQSGVAEFGPWIYQAIQELRPVVHHIIISVHAANELSPWPSPYLQALYRSWIEAGASVIHGHHAHVPQGFEEYQNGVIFYGLGNFAVNPQKWLHFSNGMWSLGAQIQFEKTVFQWKPCFFEMRAVDNADYFRVEESTATESENHWRYLQICNSPLTNPELLAALWQETAIRSYYHHDARYLGFLRPLHSRFSQFLKQAIAILKNPTAKPVKTSQSELLLWYHLFACESHRQALTTALGVLSGEIEDLKTPESRQLADLMMPWSVGIIT